MGGMGGMGGKTILVGAAIALVSAGVAAGGVYSWQRGIVDDTENRLQSALDAGREANKEMEVLGGEVGDLEVRIDKLRSRSSREQEATRMMQDCVAQASDEDTAGPREVVFGYPTLAGDSNGELMVDAAEWYSGEEANREALRDGEIEPGDSVPNDYYIRNDDPGRIMMPVREDIVVVTTTADRHNIPAPKCQTRTAFLRALRHPQPWQTSMTDSPYWMTIENGLLVRMVEQYLP
jgi:hypothetical protein